MRRLTMNLLLATSISLLLSSQVQAFSDNCSSWGCVRYPKNEGLKLTKTGQSEKTAQARRSGPSAAARPAVAVPPEVLNLQLTPPPSKP